MIRPSRVAAAVVIAGLAVTLAWNWPRQNGASEASVTTAFAAAQSTTLASLPMTPTTSLVSTTSRPVPAVGVIERVEDALSAWGRFAVSGDLAAVKPWFHPQGPQYARFVAEAADLQEDPLGNPPYSVVLSEAEITGADGVVTGRVVFARTGEPSQSFWWKIVVRGELIWTVAEP